MRLSRHQLLFAFVPIVASLVISQLNLQVIAQADTKVTICHSNDSQSNPYITNQPDRSGDVSGHDDHDGVVWYSGIADHAWGDIIPPFEYDGGSYPGKNWTAEGQAIWNNGCNIPAPTSTPTLTPVATPTPTTSLDVTPTVTLSPSPTSTVIPTPTSTLSSTLTPTAVPTSEPPRIGGDPGTTTCNDSAPGTPNNLSATRISSTQVVLRWTHGSGPHTSYLIAYGPSRGNYPYGSPNIGDTDNYTVGSLDPNSDYCFYVQAQNNCMPGNPSDVVCISRSNSTRVLGVTDNFNPLLDGINDSLGDVLGASTDLPYTSLVAPQDLSLRTGNHLDFGHSLKIASVAVNETVSLGRAIGDQLTVGQNEVMYTQFQGAALYYAHNAFGKFGKLSQLALGEVVTVTRGNVATSYQVASIQTISATDSAAVQSDDNVIYLLTCDQHDSSLRLLVKATIIR